eukprot:2657110-Pleurochrysis_carterae.AAC.1
MDVRLCRKVLRQRWHFRAPSSASSLFRSPLVLNFSPNPVLSPTVCCKLVSIAVSASCAATVARHFARTGPESDKTAHRRWRQCSKLSLQLRSSVRTRFHSRQTNEQDRSGSGAKDVREHGRDERETSAGRQTVRSGSR